MSGPGSRGLPRRGDKRVAAEVELMACLRVRSLVRALLQHEGTHRLLHPSIRGAM